MTLKNVLLKSLSLLILTLTSAVLLSGCGSNGTQDPVASAQHQERERLQAENQELPQLQIENQEVQRLKKENQELPKLRSQYQEAARLKKENDQLRQQIAKISPPPGGAHPGGVREGQATNALRPSAGQLTEKPHEPGLQEIVLNEGDDIMVDPKDLKQLLPDFDWEKLGRKEPLAIRAVLEKDGIQITNAAQLREFGITNFVIQRAQSPQTPAQEPR